MSRIGRMPITVPAGVTVTVTEENFVTVKGPKGELKKQLHGDMIIKQENGVIEVVRPSEIKKHKALHGLTRTLISNMITGDQHLSIILTSSLYKKLYQERGYESKLLSRSVEDSATVVSVLIPWNSCGMTQATVLKVATLEHLPYCFFNILSPLMSIFIAAIGYKIVKKSN